MAEVYVEKLSRFVLHHKIARVSVPDAEYISRNTLPRKGSDEIVVVVGETSFYFFLIFCHSKKFTRSYFGHKVVYNTVLAERARPESEIFVHLSDDLRIINEF